jgi:transcriptional regulator with XRE-family HTH domain
MSGNDFGKRFKKLREEAGVSQLEIARFIGKTQNAIFRYETGKSEPSIKTLVMLADYFQVSLDYLCCRTEKKQGMLFKGQIKLSDEDMKKFVEMAMTPGTITYEKLMDSIVKELQGEKK